MMNKEKIRNCDIPEEIKDICRSCESNIFAQNKGCAFRSLGNEYCDCVENATRKYLDLQKKAELREHYKHLYSEVKKQYEEADYDRHKLFEENQQLKKQKDDVVECCKNSIKSINEKLENNKELFEVVDGKIIYLNDYQVVRLKAIRMKCKEILRMLGEIDDR